MIPKKPEKIVKELSEQTDMSETLIDDVVSFYYKEVRKKLSSLEDIKINLPGLGDFMIKKTSVDKLIKKYENIINKYDTQTFINYHNKKLAQSKLEKLHNVRKKVDEFLIVKKAFRDGRKIE